MKLLWKHISAWFGPINHVGVIFSERVAHLGNCSNQFSRFFIAVVKTYRIENVT